jgi:hypothetical protein
MARGRPESIGLKNPLVLGAEVSSAKGFSQCGGFGRAVYDSPVFSFRPWVAFN